MPVLLLMTLESRMRKLAMHRSMESDIHGLHKIIDDTNVTQLQLETEIEALKEELLFMKKNHEEEIMADIQVQYDELAWENQEELDK
ncbi:hypothetical protein H8959_000537 [Pygathrix nigripes]